MSCSIVYFRKISVPIEKVRENVIWQLEGELVFYLENMETYGQEFVDLTNRQVRMVKKGLCHKAVMNRFNRYKEKINYYTRGNLYENVWNDYDPIFSVKCNYDDELFSLEETLAFFEKTPLVFHHKYSIDKAIKEVTRFWKEYPDGMITCL